MDDEFTTHWSFGGRFDQSGIRAAGERAVLAHLIACKRLRMRALGPSPRSMYLFDPHERLLLEAKSVSPPSNVMDVVTEVGTSTGNSTIPALVSANTSTLPVDIADKLPQTSISNSTNQALVLANTSTPPVDIAVTNGSSNTTGQALFLDNTPLAQLTTETDSNVQEFEPEKEIRWRQHHHPICLFPARTHCALSSTHHRMRN